MSHSWWQSILAFLAIAVLSLAAVFGLARGHDAFAARTGLSEGQTLGAPVLSATGDRLARIRSDGAVEVTDLAGQGIGLVRGHGSPLVSVHFSADGEAVITVDEDGIIRRTGLGGLALRDRVHGDPPARLAWAGVWDGGLATPARMLRAWEFSHAPWSPAASLPATGRRSPLLPKGIRPAPGRMFRDCENCPEMVVVPTGTFQMGSPEGEAGRDDDEGPQRPVRIGYRFAVGKTEVTWAEWEACVADGGCNGAGPEGAGGDEGWGRGSRPVINVSWEDAQAYAEWLSRKTGERYRLLSEAEWEYVARAGTSTRFSWGEDDPTCSRGASNAANYRSCTSDRTEPVGFSAANAFEVHDLHGNVWEWVEDCYVDSYSGAPTNGSARIVSDCPRRVLRGGSWYITPLYLRSAYRNGINPSNRINYIGFRVARTL